MEDKKKVGLIVTIVTVLLCGCPGLCGMLFGVLTASGVGEYSGNVSPGVFGGGMICVGFIGILIPIAAGIYTLQQKKKEEAVEDIEVPPAL